MKNKRTAMVFVLNISAVVVVALSVGLSLSLSTPLAITCCVLGTCLSLALIVLSFVLKYKIIKSIQKQIEEEKSKSKKQASLLDIYAILGIPPQFKPNGELKDMYELLGIAPQFDQSGKRVLTIYELLQVNPKFTQLGAEIPSILRIKNRVNSLIKLEKGTQPLTYYPRKRQVLGQKQVPQEITEQVKDDKTKPQIKDVKVVKTATKPKSAKKETLKYGKINQPSGNAKEYYASTVKPIKMGEVDIKGKDESKKDADKSGKDLPDLTTLFTAGVIKGGAEVINGVKQGIDKVAQIVDTAIKVGEKVATEIVNIPTKITTVTTPPTNIPKAEIPTRITTVTIPPIFIQKTAIPTKITTVTTPPLYRQNVVNPRGNHKQNTKGGLDSVTILSLIDANDLTKTNGQEPENI